ncbi:hypothetical protein JRO89_XS03G0287000 [Xanthoceras sorbifolium]|uniref:EamA domain-containing protein n=1 Tax=Xanthoceras sorbifolium TaxID=99658 RepID=A0ABQ8ICL7_9ROSI|nr:hypothetical protein JRO89_XS03G0287000 [Xanthoceras sorbifolium]
MGTIWRCAGDTCVEITRSRRVVSDGIFDLTARLIDEMFDAMGYRPVLKCFAYQFEVAKRTLHFLTLVAILLVLQVSIIPGVYKSYQHPFAVTYLATSLLVVHLPFAFIKDWLRSILRHRFCKSSNGEEMDDKSSRELDSGAYDNTENEHHGSSSNKECTIDICAKEDNAETQKQDEKLTSKEVAATGFCIAPIWFLTEYLTNAALSRTSVASTTVLSSTSGLFTLLISALLGQDKVNAVKVISVVISMAGVAMTTLGNTWAANESQSSTSNRERKQSLLGDLFAILSAITYALFTVLLKKFSGEQGERVDMQKLLGYIGLFTLVALWWLGKIELLARPLIQCFDAFYYMMISENGETKDIAANIPVFVLSVFDCFYKKMWPHSSKSFKLHSNSPFSEWPLTAIGIETKLTFPHSAETAGIILVNGFIGSFLCDYFWALGVVWTSPLVAAVGVSLTIPVAMLEDMFMHGQHYSIIYMIGSALVFLGFVIANLADWIHQS